MRPHFLFQVVCLFLAFVSGVTGSAAWGGDSEPVLRLFTWAEYFSPEVLAEFEKRHHCRVTLDYYDDDAAMFYKLKFSGGYDVVTPAPSTAHILNSQDMLLRLDHSRIPNLGNIKKTDPKFTQDPDMTYSVPYTLSVSGVAYNRTKVAESDIGSWNIFGNPAYAMRMAMLNDLREALAAPLKTLGYSGNTTSEKEIAEAADLLIASWKPNLALFATAEAGIGLVTEELYVCQTYSGGAALAIRENPDLGFFIPREGATVTSDDLVIVADTKQPDLAYAFINHILDPEMAAKNMEYTLFYMPNPKAMELLPDEIGRDPVFTAPKTGMENCELLRNLGDDVAKYIAAWDRVKTH